jgi:NAD+ synthase (glutamine-hydrolysing)
MVPADGPWVNGRRRHRASAPADPSPNLSLPALPCYHPQVRVALCQINPTVGDFAGNRAKVLAMARRAREERCDLAVFPELCLCGYPPMDLLEHASFVEANLESLRELQREAPAGVGLVIGYVDWNRGRQGRRLANAASLVEDGKVLFAQTKTLLPTYDVFDEARYFEPAAARRVVPFRGERLGIAICEDIWWEGEPAPGLHYPVDPVKELADEGATLLVSLSASPFHLGKIRTRLDLLTRIARTCGLPAVYVNSVGANDSLVFDGRSLATAADGRLVHAARAFAEDFAVVDTAAPGPAVDAPADGWDELESALVLGIRDYAAKCGFERAHLGLSGGIDSALVAVLAVEALGSDRVAVFGMPSRYSSPGSVSDARDLADALGLRLQLLPIEDAFTAHLRTLDPVFAGRQPDVTEENLQARIRGALLMAWSNKTGSLLLATGNKSELATGYCTLYGDMCGGLARIGDLLKTQVYGLSRAINGKKRLIPDATFGKAPSAELRPDQTDQETLPAYDVLDRILDRFIVGNRSAAEIAAEGFDPGLVHRVIGMVERAEYKRRQAPPVLRVSPRAFGLGRRIPIARRFR